MPLVPDEIRGVRLDDIFRDQDGYLWEVVGICTEPTAIVRKLASGEQEQHVIGCRNWESKWSAGPLRAPREAS